MLASEQQAHEVGDGTNFVIVFAGMLLHKAEGLLRMGTMTSTPFCSGSLGSLPPTPLSPCHIIVVYLPVRDIVR